MGSKDGAGGAIAAAFGERLRSLRQRASLTQRDLARALGLKNHGEISQWEGGRRPVPASHLPRLAELYGVTVAELTGLHDRVTRDAERRRAMRLLGWPASGSGPIGNVDARRRTPNFVGRAVELRRIAEGFSGSSGRIQIITGMPGVGKSQLALAYAAMHADRYDVVWSVAAAEPAAVPLQISELATLLGLGSEDPSVEGNAQRVMAELARRGRWLLIIDGAEDPEMVRQICPIDSGGHVLVTSRQQAWRSVGEPLALGVLPADDAALLLRRRTGRSDAMEPLASMLGGLPLALEQAGALIEASGVSVDAYADKLRDEPSVALAAGSPSLYDNTVAKTMKLLVEELSRTNPAAADLLIQCSVLGSAPIPRRPLGFDANAITRLHAASLLRVEDGFLHVHPLVQSYLRDWLPAEATERAATAMCAALIEALPPDRLDAASWPSHDEWVPHALPLAAASGAPEAAVVLTDVAGYLGLRGRHADGLRFIEGAIGVLRAHEAEGGALADALHNAGAIASRTSTEAARAFYNESLVAREKASGRGDLRFAGTEAALGSTYIDDDPALAVTILEAALDKIAEVESRDHPFAIQMAGNLALALENAGDASRSLAVRRDSLERCLRSVGATHLLTAHAHANLALVEGDDRDVDRRHHATEALRIYDELGFDDGDQDDLRALL